MKRSDIPPDILRAARRAGLSYPAWYVGPRIDPTKPRKKTLADLIAEVEAEEAAERAAFPSLDDERQSER